MEQTLKGKIVFVTGSARRVGRSIALAFARQGAHLVIHHSNSDAQATETAQEVRALDVDALVVKGDHGRHADVEHNFGELLAHYGRLDVMVNSAAIFPKEDLLNVSPEEWQQVIDINLSGPFWCTQHAGRIMRASGQGGVIINIGDNAGSRPWKQRPHHSISKAGVLMLTQVSALSLADYNIRVNCVVPGPVLKPDGMDDEYWEKHVEVHLPLKRSGDPEDVARAAVFLAKNDFINGAILRVDGGEFLHDR